MRVRKLGLTALGALFLSLGSANAQTISIGGDQYAFQFTGNPNFGLFFSLTNGQYEFRNGSANSVFAIDAVTGRLNTNIDFSPGSDLLIANNRYAFRAKSNPNFGLFFSAATTEYQFLNNSASPVFALGANNGNLRLGGSVTLGPNSTAQAGAIRWTGTDFQGYDGSAWNSLTTGPAGPQGPVGPQGPQGPAGLLPSGSTGAVPYYNGIFWQVSNTNIRSDGTSVGIGVAPSPSSRVVAEDLGEDAIGGRSVIAANRSGLTTGPGSLTSWGVTDCDAALRGFSDYGNAFAAAVHGSSFLDFENSASVVGANVFGSIFGALAYNRGTGGVKAGYFQGDVEVTGDTEIEGKVAIGGSTVESDVQLQVDGGMFINSNLGVFRIGYPDGADGWEVGTVNGGEDLQFQSRTNLGDFDPKFVMNQNGDFSVLDGKITVQPSNADSVGVALEGDPLSDPTNYYKAQNWVFGESDGSGPSISGDYIMSRFGDQQYIFWTSYLSPVNDGIKDLGRFSERWDAVYAANGTIITSDAREKKNIEDLDYGLDALMKLKPVSYEWKDEHLNRGTKLGFLAQDLLEVVPEVVAAQEKVVDRETGEISFKEAERLGVFYDDLIPVLTKAIQEQQATIEDQNESIAELLDAVENLSEENESLKDLLSNVTSKIERVEQDLVSCCFESGSDESNGSTINANPELGQNIPNPFSESTVIQYYLPESSTNAIIRITDINGSPVEDIRLGDQAGANQIEFQTQGLASGTYLYSLFVDGKFIDTKKMVVTN